MTDEWRVKAECRNHDANLWGSREASGTARHICITHCPVRGQCKVWAHGMGRWQDQVVGGEWWVEDHSRIMRPSKMQPPVNTVYCKLCHPDAPTLPRPKDPPIVRCPECHRGVGLDASGQVHWHFPSGRQGPMCPGTGSRP